MGGGGYYSSAPSSSAFPSSTTPTKPPKPKAPKSSTPKKPGGGGSKGGGPPGTPQKIKSESLPLLVQHDMGASPMKPKFGKSDAAILNGKNKVYSSLPNRRHGVIVDTPYFSRS